MTKLLVAFRNIAHVPKNQNLYIPLSLDVISVAPSLQQIANIYYFFLFRFFLS
jgi:hypothetical protein